MHKVCEKQFLVFQIAFLKFKIFRCVFTNVDEETGIKSPISEPLETLKSYRKFPETGETPVMGLHLGTRQSGVVKLGDSVYIPA